MHIHSGRFSIEFPAGLVDAGESLEQAAKRELAEETGYHGEIKVHIYNVASGYEANLQC